MFTSNAENGKHVQWTHVFIVRRSHAFWEKVKIQMSNKNTRLHFIKTLKAQEDWSISINGIFYPFFFKFH